MPYQKLAIVETIVAIAAHGAAVVSVVGGIGWIALYIREIILTILSFTEKSARMKHLRPAPLTEEFLETLKSFVSKPWIKIPNVDIRMPVNSLRTFNDI